MAIARYTLAVDRRFKRDGQDGADFIPCVVFGKGGEFAEKYLRKGTKVAIVGRIQTGSYTDRDGKKVYTTEIVIEEQEFAESKNGGQAPSQKPAGKPAKEEDGMDGFMNIPDGIEEEELPFN